MKLGGLASGCVQESAISRLPRERATPMLDAMKTLTTREFFHLPGLLKSLRPGESVIVTDNGKASLTVTKAGKRPRRTREDLEREAREIFPGSRPGANFTKMIQDLKR